MCIIQIIKIGIKTNLSWFDFICSRNLLQKFAPEPGLFMVTGVVSSACCMLFSCKFRGKWVRGEELGKGIG